MTTGGPDPARYREMNRAMVQRLRGSAPPPVPLAVVHHDDRRYLVAPDARRDRGANLDADPRAGIEAGGGVEEVRVTRIAGRPAAHVVAAYAAAATGPARAAFPFGDDPDITEVEAVLDRTAVFEVVGGPA